MSSSETAATGGGNGGGARASVPLVVPAIDSVIVAETLPPSVQHFHSKVLPSIAIVSTQDELDAERVERAVIFGTHSGKFHTDEALGLAMRCMMVPRQAPKIIIVRSRAQPLLSQCSEIFDVGHRYDPEAGFFDHHQKEFNEYFFDKPDANKTMMATAGLVHKQWGERLIASLYAEAEASESLLDELYAEMYTDFVEAVDASDNGFSITPRGVRPRYRITTALQSQVGELNQPLMAEADAVPDLSQNNRFLHAMLVTFRPFLVMLHNKVQKIRLAAPIVSEALLACVKRGDQLLILPSPCPWKKMLKRLEEDADLESHEAPLLCVAPSDGRACMILTIPIDAGNYYLGSRLRLPEEWAGKEKQELSDITGIDGCVFCHRGQFIAGNETLEGAVAMAKKAIDLDCRSGVKEILEMSRIAGTAGSVQGGAAKRSKIEAREETGEEEERGQETNATSGAQVQAQAQAQVQAQVQAQAQAQAQVQAQAQGSAGPRSVSLPHERAVPHRYDQ